MVRLIAEQFHPQKIILYGSYAYGQPSQLSVVDLLVYSPEKLKQRIALGDSFLKEIKSVEF